MEKKKKGIGKKIACAILLILVIFILILFRKWIILSNLKNKVSQYVESENYHVKISSYMGNTLTIAQTYQKEEKSLTTLTYISESDIRKLTNFYDGMKTNTYIDSNGSKIAILNSNGIPSPLTVQNYLYTNSFGEYLQMIAMSSIQSVKCNGKECYRISGVLSDSLLMGEEERQIGVYIEKDTGLPVRILNGTQTNSKGEKTSTILDYQYEFNHVTEGDLQEPDVTLYKIEG